MKSCGALGEIGSAATRTGSTTGGRASGRSYAATTAPLDSIWPIWGILDWTGERTRRNRCLPLAAIRVETILGSAPRVRPTATPSIRSRAAAYFSRKPVKTDHHLRIATIDITFGAGADLRQLTAPLLQSGRQSGCRVSSIARTAARRGDIGYPYERAVGQRGDCELLGEHAPPQPRAHRGSESLGRQTRYVGLKM